MKEKDLIFQLRKGLNLTNVQLADLLSAIAAYSDNLRIAPGTGISIEVDPNNPGVVTISVADSVLDHISAVETEIGKLTQSIAELQSQVSDLAAKIPENLSTTIDSMLEDISTVSEKATHNGSQINTIQGLISKLPSYAQTIKKISITGDVHGETTIPDNTAADAKEVTIIVSGGGVN